MAGYYHRTHNYWEPTYDGRTKLSDLSSFIWATLFTGSGPYKKICHWDNYQENKRLISDKKFNMCDFSGDLSNITFKDCEFKNCFWNRYIWKKIKFQNCKFEKSSFSFANFLNCQFFNCTFTNIGLSGNETVFINCIIDSKKLIASAYTNEDAQTLALHRKTPFSQRAHLSKTKSEIAQKLRHLNNQFSEFYYSSIEVAVLQEIKARIEMRFCENERKHWIVTIIHWVNVLFWTLIDTIELIVMFVSGKIFGWGESFFKCIFSGLCIVALFSIYYHFQRANLSWFDSFARAFDITIIAGYSKYGTKSSPPIGIAEFLNLGFGIFWYSIAIPTITNKFTRRSD